MNNVDVNTNNIFAFWESQEPIPAYLELCKDTWIKNIPNCQIHILNHSNLQHYIGDTYHLDDLKKISFAMQSDIISAAILEKFGGLFLDIDCIVIDDLFHIFNSISQDKLIAFGRPAAFTIHLAVLYSKKPNNPILTGWRQEAQKRLKNIPEKYDWSYFGNAIINPLLQVDNNKNSFIIDRLISGNILETITFQDEEVGRAIANYKNFYFNEYLGFNEKSLSLANFGVISLHNSWTPEKYKSIKDKSGFLKENIPLAKMLGYVLNNNIKVDFSKSILSVEAFLRNHLSKLNIPHQVKYINSMLVLDLKHQSSQFAFDVKYIIDSDKITADLVLRNIEPNLVKDHEYFVQRGIKFINNKCSLGIYQNSQDLLDTILEINILIEEILTYKSISDFQQHLVDGTYLNLEKLEVIDNLLFVTGVAFIENESIYEYSDIDYQLLFVQNGTTKYKKPLGKVHRPEITSQFAINQGINYDKSGFATPKFQGVDISDLESGTYQLYLYIKTKTSTRIQSIRSLSNKNFDNINYYFDCNQIDNVFIIKEIADNIAVSEYTNQKIKINGNYIDSKNNKIIAPKNLQNCFIQFLGGNNEITIDEHANLKNCSLEVREGGRIVIKKDVSLHGHLRLGYNSYIEIGSNTSSTNPVYATVAEGTKLIIGNDCMFATNNQIRTDDAHAIYDLDTGKRVNHSKNIVIGDHVWVGYGATILGGANIGGGCVVGAFSLVNKQFPNNCIVVGTPAKIVRENIFWKRPLLLNKIYSENEVALPDTTYEIQKSNNSHLDVFIHAHPDDIELFMGIASKKAIDNNHKIVMLLATSGDGGAKERYLNTKNGQKVSYPEGRLKAHDEAIKYLLNSKENGFIQNEIVNNHSIRCTIFQNMIWSYNLMLPDGYQGIGFASNNFEALEKLYLGKINSITSLDGNFYNSLEDLKNTITDLLLKHTLQYQNITFHIPEMDETLNKGAHSDHIFLSKLLNDIILSKKLGSVEVRLYSDYINATKPVNLNSKDEAFHRQLNNLIDDVLIENGRESNVRTLHLGFLGKEYITSSYLIK